MYPTLQTFLPTYPTQPNHSVRYANGKLKKTKGSQYSQEADTLMNNIKQNSSD